MFLAIMRTSAFGGFLYVELTRRLNFLQHVASNPYTRYRPFPTPAQFTASQDYISRATIFIRRELRVWVGLDVEVSHSGEGV